MGAGDGTVGDRRRGADSGLPAVRVVGSVLCAALLQSVAVGFVLHRLHEDPAQSHEAVYISPTLHWLRDSALSFPAAFVLLLVGTLGVRRALAASGRSADGVGAYVLWASVGAGASSLASVPGAYVHSLLFTATHDEGSLVLHSLQESILTLRCSFGLLVVYSLAFGLPWAPSPLARVARTAERAPSLPSKEAPCR